MPLSLFITSGSNMADGYATSDAEWDSELESDSDSELSHWLDQLNQYSKVRRLHAEMSAC